MKILFRPILTKIVVYRLGGIMWMSHISFYLLSLPGFEPLPQNLKATTLPLLCQATGWQPIPKPWFCSKLCSVLLYTG